MRFEGPEGDSVTFSVSMRQLRFMVNTIPVDPQDPLGPATLKPVRSHLNDAGCEELVALTSFVGVFLERIDEHPRF